MKNSEKIIKNSYYDDPDGDCNSIHFASNGYADPLYDMLNSQARALVSKKYVQPHALDVFNPRNFGRIREQYLAQPTKTYRCSRCMIEINAPRDWIVEHVKTHMTKEKETNHVRVNPY